MTAALLAVFALLTTWCVFVIRYRLDLLEDHNHVGPGGGSAIGPRRCQCPACRTCLCSRHRP